MKQAVIYIHGKGGSAAEAAHYKPLFPGFDVIGFDYSADTPWDAKREFTSYFDTICAHFDTVYIAANSIGAFFAMNARTNEKIKQAVSPLWRGCFSVMLRLSVRKIQKMTCERYFM